MKQTTTLLIIMLLALKGTAQMKVIKDSLFSDNLKEERQIEVELPDDYDPASGKKYEVIYVTDGEWNNDIVAHMQRFVQIQFVPPCIVVSMKHMGFRDRDFTPTRVEWNERSGGADKFLAFMKSELMPYIEKKYPARTDNRVYIGSSLAGLFGMYIFLRDPQLFQSYLLSDPAMWWDNGVLIKEAGEKLGNYKGAHLSLYITGREGPAFREMGVSELDSLLKAKAPGDLHWKVVKYAGETHNSMIFKTVYDGLKFTWAGYTTDNPGYHPMTGIILKDKPFTIFTWPDERANWHYTTDGTTPTDASPKVTGQMNVTVPVQFNLKAICVRDEYSRTINGTFKIGNTLSSIPLPKKLKPGGLDSTKGQIAGGVNIPEDGYYVFCLMHPEGNTNISLGDQVLFNYDTTKGTQDDKTFIVPLQKGYYPIKMTYADKVPVLQWIIPGKMGPEAMPGAVLYHH